MVDSVTSTVSRAGGIWEEVIFIEKISKLVVG